MAAVPKKTGNVQTVINQAIHLLEACGIPLSDKSPRLREKAAMAFLAVAGVTHAAAWPSAGEQPPLGTRKIIQFLNKHFGQNISLGSYDDIRRRDLKDVVAAGLVVASAGKPGASVNDPTRGYALDEAFAALVRSYGQKGWLASVAAFMAGRPSLAESLSGKEVFSAVPVTLPGGKVLSLTGGPHNLLQKAIVEQFLPRFGHGASVVYVGDTADKLRHVDSELANRLSLDLDPARKIPDVIAYSPQKNWLYLVEAVHSSGPITNHRRLELATFAGKSGAGLVFVTAFLDLQAFAKHASQIGWETEVWIAAEPDHMLHWNGDRFMGPR